LEEAFTGHFTGHHAFLLQRMLARVDAINVDIAALEAKIENEMSPFVAAVAKLDEIPGINPAAAYVILAEIGLDMHRFPTAGHLVSWARFAPGVKESAGKKKGTNATGHGNSYLARVLGNAAVAAGKTDTFLGERYRRTARRRGRKKAVVAIGRSLLVIIWHLLSDDDARFHDLGADFYTTASTPNAANEVTSASSKPSAARSPSNQQPDPNSPQRHGHSPIEVPWADARAVEHQFSD
jgi:transposase